MKRPARRTPGGAFLCAILIITPYRRGVNFFRAVCLSRWKFEAIRRRAYSTPRNSPLVVSSRWGVSMSHAKL
ncbi:hypothetical protein QEH32_gp07 [Corynebacterium phage EmiRose]|uniref:Uncharacterized protein n=1 Tax=Corynebacterium phage EmiRose TaxID=2565372 RepID=A0A649VQB1_9CAUD|nr:hypothetical protein QEH32_gp07 [Corynebacterium phage EmiRose]QGJ94179.1 hypothetical protein SEA_EMIROSE_7 [Corynebacterium phage EmiRose]